MDIKNFFYFLLLLTLQLISAAKVIEIDDNLLELKYKDINYLNAYKISSSIMNYKSNGGSVSLHNLSLAFDNNFNTFWQSEKYQEASFLNNIQITFSKTVTIDRMIYQAPSFPKVKGDGYPIELKIYFKLKKPDGTLSEEDSDFLLVEDIISERTENKVIFIFDEKIICDRIKIEWAEIEETVSTFLWALASEIILLFPENEYINELIYDIYNPNDYAQISINPNYNDINIINEIEEKIKNYVDISEGLKELIERIKKIINGELKYEKRREFTTNLNRKLNLINQYGDIEDYSTKKLKMKSGATNRQPTGIYGFSNEMIIIYVDSNDNDPLPSIRFSQYMGLTHKWISSPIKLKKGKNILKIGEYDIKDIEIKIKSGGPIYIENAYKSDEQSQNIRIYIEGGILFPFFRLNDNEEEFKLILDNYMQLYNKNIDTYYNIVEFYSNRITITANATYAQELYNIKNESPQLNMQNWDRIMKIYYSFDGIQFEEDQPFYNKNNEFLNIHLRYCQPYKKGIAAYSSSDHIGIFLPQTFNYVLLSHKNYDSVVAHEIGHMIDVINRERAEVTNMVIEEFAKQALYKNYLNNKLSKFIQDALSPDNIDNLFRRCFNKPNCYGFFINVGLYTYAHYVWWDIISFYPDYWGKLDNLYRYNFSLTYGMNKNEVMVYFSSLILGFDLGYYFERFGLGLENNKPFNNSDTSTYYRNKMEEAISQGKINTSIYKKMWYADNDQYDYSLSNGLGCNYSNNYNVEIFNITKENILEKFNISLPSINCEGHLGFEIVENEKVIAFTQKSYYLDKTNYSYDYIPKYKIVAYDRLLNNFCLYPKESIAKDVKLKNSQIFKKFLKFK